MGGCSNSRIQINDDAILNEQERLRLENITSRTNIRDVYTFSSILGKGGFGTVKLAVLKSGLSDKKMAIKIIEKSRLKQRTYVLLRELEILQSLDHPNIIKFYEVYQDEMFFYICMEYCAGGELLDRITKSRNFKEQDAALIMDKIFSAINHMHSKGVVHRDIKPENILFLSKSPDSEIKIVDFGLSVKCDDFHDLTTQVGTPLYVSPNVLKGRYDSSSDNWSAGVILYVLLVGYPPFFSKNRGEVFKKIEKGIYSIEGKDWENVSEEAKNLVKKLLVVDSKNRMTAAQALKDKWIVKYKKISEWSNFKPQSSSASAGEIDPKILNMMKNFRAGSKLRTEVMKILVNLLNEKEIETLKNAFKAMDNDQTGQIKISHLQEAMEAGGFSQTNEELENIIRNISPNQEGKELSISYSEFIAATLDHVVYLKQEKIWSLFKYFDPTNSNFITLESLKEIFLRNGRNIPEEELKQMVKEVDPNNDGKISLDEFKLLMKGEEIDFKS